MTEILDVCICTHNPNPAIFAKTLSSLANQTLGKEYYRVWIIDNFSDPPLTKSNFQLLAEKGINYSILVEKRLGLVFARQCAIEATTSDVLVFVDDDNELYDDYLERVLAIANQNPQIGCFGGRQYLPPEEICPDWGKPFLPFFAVEDRGEEVISNCANSWGKWEPCGAGMVARRPVLEQYVRQFKSASLSSKIGRKGKKGLMSGSDSLLARGSYFVGLECSYQPDLKLIHRIDLTTRLKYSYLLKLFLNYGRSYVVLERVLGQTIQPVTWSEAIRQVLDNMQHRQSEYRLFNLCMVMWDVGRLLEGGIIGNADVWKPWKWTFLNLPSQERRVLAQVTATANRIPLSERGSILGDLKGKFPQLWEFCRQIALKLKIIT